MYTQCVETAEKPGLFFDMGEGSNVLPIKRRDGPRVAADKSDGSTAQHRRWGLQFYR